MLLRDPLTSLFPGSAAVVLRVLARTYQPLSGRQVASLVEPHASLRTVQVALDHLVEQGIVHVGKVGNAHQYTFNRDHLAAPAIESLLGMRAALKDAIQTEVSAWPVEIVGLWIFGSVARRQDTVGSDIDLLVIRGAQVDADSDEWVDLTSVLGRHVYEWTGNECEIVDVSERELSKWIDDDSPLVLELQRDAEHVFGKTPRELLVGVK